MPRGIRGTRGRRGSRSQPIKKDERGFVKRLLWWMYPKPKNEQAEQAEEEKGDG